MAPGFEVVSPPGGVLVVGRGRRLGELARLARVYGFGFWERRRGIANLWLKEGRVAIAEIHWTVPRPGACVEMKIKRFLVDPG